MGLVSGDLSSMYLHLLPQILVLCRIASPAEPPVCSGGPGGHQGVRAAGGGWCLAARSSPGTSASSHAHEPLSQPQPPDTPCSLLDAAPTGMGTWPQHGQAWGASRCSGTSPSELVSSGEKLHFSLKTHRAIAICIPTERSTALVVPAEISERKSHFSNPFLFPHPIFQLFFPAHPETQEVFQGGKKTMKWRKAFPFSVTFITGTEKEQKTTPRGTWRAVFIARSVQAVLKKKINK